MAEASLRAFSENFLTFWMRPLSGVHFPCSVEAFCRFLALCMQLKDELSGQGQGQGGPHSAGLLGHSPAQGEEGSENGAGRTILCSWFLSPHAGRKEGPLTLPLRAGESLLALILFVLFRWYF